MSATIYIVTIDDRHSGPYPYLYADPDNALTRAREATVEAEEHYHVKADLTLFPGQIFRSYIEDACTVTVEQSKILDVEDT